MFGSNLRHLASRYNSISELARQLGINRTQFNRYLSGESFPRPDVLARVCAFFEVDARVLLEPVDQIGSGQDPIDNPFLREFVGAGAKHVSEDLFPNGFYRFSRRSFMQQEVFFVGIVHIRRSGQNTFLRGFESAEAMRVQGLPSDVATREYRGIVMQQESGVVFVASRRNSMTSSFNYLSRVASFENNFWTGYITRTVPDNVGGLRATRMAFEHLGPAPKDAMPAARASGFHTRDELPPFHQRLLKPGETFS